MKFLKNHFCSLSLVITAHFGKPELLFRHSVNDAVRTNWKRVEIHFKKMEQNKSRIEVIPCAVQPSLFRVEKVIVVLTACGNASWNEI